MVTHFHIYIKVFWYYILVSYKSFLSHYTLENLALKVFSL